MSAQLSLPDFPPPDLGKARAQKRARFAQDIQYGLIVDVPMSRADHPETSQEAGEFLHRSGARASMQRKVLKFVRQFPGSILLEIMAGTGISKHNVASRLAELKGNEKTPPMVYQGEKRKFGRLSYREWFPAEKASP